ncbi:hypothetical protein K3X44_05855 [Aliiroseovarius crassostreae]|uniref:hypothetical protein n=1 Tax=Aliiroseovarius crassostreae TaxID=154981 RepID=UPI0021FD5EB5|nr:hypothetical protein [Aliiroseovarius crassostreae]UWQ02844.1 hypothetical protein K3X44_05855 [Aliiroseovarius crassostreae]
MLRNQPQSVLNPLFSAKDLSFFLTTSQAFARNLMKEIGIPKRGKGYPRARLLAALGFPHPLPTDEEALLQPLLDPQRAAAASGTSANTFGRMFDGSHHDQTFKNYIHLGPRKRLIFPFELDAWMTGVPPKFMRDKSLMHPRLRGAKASVSAQTRQMLPVSASGPQAATSTYFLPPKR